VAGILKLSVSTIRNLIRAGKIKTIDVGSIRISEEALKDYIEGK
jgi:excisionase family DNA binding protein